MSGSLQETGSGSVKGNYENELLRFLPHDLEFQRDPCSPVLLLAACESDSKLKPTFKYNSVCRILLKEVSAGAARQSTVRSASKDSTVRQKGGRSGVLQDLLPKLSQVVENPSDPDQTHLTLPADSKLWCRDKAVKRVPPPAESSTTKPWSFVLFVKASHQHPAQVSLLRQTNTIHTYPSGFNTNSSHGESKMTERSYRLLSHRWIGYKSVWIH